MEVGVTQQVLPLNIPPVRRPADVQIPVRLYNTVIELVCRAYQTGV
jgi:hypothetical protein